MAQKRKSTKRTPVTPRPPKTKDTDHYDSVSWGPTVNNATDGFCPSAAEQSGFPWWVVLLILLLGLLAALIASTAHAAPPAQDVSVIPRMKAANEPAWWKWTARLPRGNYGPVLTDLECHGGPNNATYRDAADSTSWGHELTHYVNSLIRNSLGDNGINGFYVLDDRCIVLHEPHFTLSEVARRVTQRGPIYGLYLGSQLADWNAHPTYILDEMIAYSNGALAGSFTGSDQWRYQRQCAQELSGYAKVLIQTIDQLDPGYVDRQQLVNFIYWNDNRLQRMQ